MPSVNMRSAANISPSVIVSGYVPTTGVAQYQPDTDAGAQVISWSVHNQDTVDRTVTLAIVRAADSAGPSNKRVFVMTPDQVMDLPEMVLGGGDFIWAEAVTASTIDIVITALEFSDGAGAVAAGVHEDFVGSGCSGLSGSLTPETCKISALPNRRLITNLLVQQGATSFGWANYTGGAPTVNCSDGPMTRKASIDIVNAGGTIVGSVHQFNFDNPTSGSTQTITPAAAAAGATMNLVTSSKAYSGVDLAAALSVVSNASQTAALSLPFTGMGAGVVPVMAAGFVAGIPLKYNMDAIRLDAILSAFQIPQYLLAADKFGVSALTAIDSNASNPYGAVGQVLHPA